MSSAYLILADGTVFEGSSIGAEGKTVGEVVFTTGMTGYIETLTDPSYFGQIVTQTFPLIGNYGVINEDFESRKSYVRGYIVRELCEKPSNFRCEGDLDSFLKTQNIVGICGIDTRALTKKLREAGVMNGMIVSGKEAVKIAESCQTIQKPELNIADTDKHRLTKTDDQKLLNEIREYKIEDAVKSVQKSVGDFKGQSPLGEGVAKIPERSGEGRACSDFSGVVRGIGARGRLSPTLIPKFSVCLIDFGAKANIQRELEKRGCTVTVVPYNTTAKEIIVLSPDGIMLSNGPGDPAENTGVIEEIRKLCEYGKIPIFGICLGHQMLALARGAQTQKLKYGHRGGNHPCKNLETGRVYITSQNHGYAVKTESLPSCAELSFINSNDGTCEGIKYTDIPAFSVQFHPEACGGPHDTNFLFDDFVKMMEKNHASK